MTELYIKIKPDSEELDVDTSDHIMEIKLTEKAENQRANTQLLELIEQKTGKEASIKKGHRSRRKKIRTELSEEKFREKIEE